MSTNLLTDSAPIVMAANLSDADKAVNESARILGHQAMTQAQTMASQTVTNMADAASTGQLGPDDWARKMLTTDIDDTAKGLRKAGFDIGVNQTAQVLGVEPVSIIPNITPEWDGESVAARINKLMGQARADGLGAEEAIQYAADRAAPYVSGMLDGDYQASLREGMYKASEAAPVIGYVKVPGPLACSWCRLVSDRIYWTRVPFHQACRCGMSIVQPGDLSSKDQIRSALRRAGVGNSTVDRYTATYDRLLRQGDVRGAAAQVDNALARAAKQSDLTAARIARIADQTGVRQPYDGMTVELIDNASTTAIATDNRVMAEAYRMAGYDDLPTLVDDAEFAALRDNPDYYHGFRGTYRAERVVSSDLDPAEMSRQLKAPPTYEEFTQYSRDLMEGDYFPGRGIFGNGTYTAIATKRASVGLAHDTARSYGRGGSVIEFAMSKSARIARVEDLYGPEYDEWVEAVMDRTRDRFAGVANSTINADAVDISMYAIEKGYDALFADDYLIVLNRAKMIINKRIEVDP